jgi:hypothetical protein
LSTMDFYLDPSSLLPLAVASNVHPDNDMNRDIPSEIRFAEYRPIKGVQIPFHIQQMLNGSLLTDVTVNDAQINSQINNTQFTLQ